jgi:hypothetical protein
LTLDWQYINIPNVKDRLAQKQAQVTISHMTFPFLELTRGTQSHIILHCSRVQPQKKEVGRACMHRRYVLGDNGSNGYGIWNL